MPAIDLSILNQRQTPAFYADVFANRPAAGFVGRIFVSTNTFAFYRDNGTGWDLIGGPGTGTITGSGTAGTIPLWSGASTIADSDLRQLSSEALILNSSTNDWPTTNFANDAGRFLITSTTNNPFLLLWGKSAFGSGNSEGSIALGNVTALGSTTFGGALLNGYIENGTDGSGSFEIKTTNTAGVETLALTINSTQNTIFNNSIGINTATPGAAIDAHSAVNIIAQLNQTTATNNSLLAFQNSNAGLWRIGSFYNAGANDFGIFDVIGSIQPLTVKKTTGQVLIGTSTVGSGKLVVASATSDNGIQIVGANAPSLRIDSAESGPTKRAGFGISTATNNFIQGSADRDFCMFNGSTTASPILFGIYGTTNVQEAARISSARNFLIGTTTDNGSKLQVSGTSYFNGNLEVGGTGFVSPSGADRFIGVYGGQDCSLILQDAVQLWEVYVNDDFYINRGSTTVFAASRTSGNVAIDSVNSYLAKLNVANISSGSVTRGLSLFNNSGDVSGTGISIEFYPNAGNDDRCARISSNNTATGLYADLRFSTANAALTAEAMRITPGGNLLIGTTTDGGSKLQVNGSATINTNSSQTYSKLVVAGAICYNNNTNQAISDNGYGMSFAAKLNIVAGSGANTIYSQAGSEGALYVVSGLDLTTSSRFVDLVLYLGAAGTTPVVVSSQTIGTVPTRTYTNVSESLTLSLTGNTNTYTIRMTGIGANEKT